MIKLFSPEFDQVSIVLVGTTHPGNIGAVARAMFNMGLGRLVLVQPAKFPHSEATARASGAVQVLSDAIVVDDLASAVQDCEFVIGASARDRNLPWPMLAPRSCAEKVLAMPGQKIAIVFGREHSGLSNEELALCQYHLQIPTNPKFSSLNLAMAVQVVVYELRMAMLAGREDAESDDEGLALAKQSDVEGFYQHFEQVLTDMEFFTPGKEDILMLRLKRLFARTQLETTEINILRGILSAIEKKMPAL